MTDVTVPSTITFKSINVPNFVGINDGRTHKRGASPMKPVSDLSYDEAHALAEQWRKDFLNKAGHAGAL